MYKELLAAVYRCLICAMNRWHINFYTLQIHYHTFSLQSRRFYSHRNYYDFVLLTVVKVCRDKVYAIQPVVGHWLCEYFKFYFAIFHKTVHLNVIVAFNASSCFFFRADIEWSQLFRLILCGFLYVPLAGSINALQL